jgi:hypothetical protein
MEDCWQFLSELRILLPYDPATVLLGIYPKEMKTYARTKIYILMFTQLYAQLPR